MVFLWFGVWFVWGFEGLGSLRGFLFSWEVRRSVFAFKKVFFPRGNGMAPIFLEVSKA